MDTINTSANGEQRPLIDDPPSRSRLDTVFRPVAAEFVAVTLFVFVGGLAVYTKGESEDIFGVAAAHGFTIALLIIGFGEISGGHINPAVTLGVMLAGAISPILAVFYFLAQLCGGILGALLSYGALSFEVSENRTAFESISCGGQELGSGVNWQSGLLCEVVLTFALVTSVLNAAVDSDGKNVLAPLAIGFTVFVDILAGGAVSGASMNPARSFGPAVLGHLVDVDLWTNHWIYWLGPAVGATLAGLLYRFFFINPDKRRIPGCS